jgi:hypothetical protein
MSLPESKQYKTRENRHSNLAFDHMVLAYYLYSPKKYEQIEYMEVKKPQFYCSE